MWGEKYDGAPSDDSSLKYDFVVVEELCRTIGLYVNLLSSSIQEIKYLG